MKRKHSGWHYARRITREMWHHPSNRGHRVRALLRGYGWQVRKRIRPRPVDVPYEGLVLRCHPDSNSASNVFYFTSRYDHHEMAFLERYLRPGDGYLDIGANIGTYSLLAASIVGREGRIEAFEPLPSAAARVRENLELNDLPNAVLHEVAVADEPGEVGFLDFDVSSAIEHQPERYGPATIRVRQDRIDACATGSTYAAAKLDVEGMELRALHGAQRLIDARTPPVWQVELIDSQLRKLGASAEEVVDWMAAQGFTPWWYDADTGTLTSTASSWRDHPNCLFIAEDRLDHVRERLG